MRWFLEELDVPVDGNAMPGAPYLGDAFVSYADAELQLRWLRSLGAEERADWFAEHRTEIAQGVLTWADFG